MIEPSDRTKLFMTIFTNTMVIVDTATAGLPPAKPQHNKTTVIIGARQMIDLWRLV
jgi:hypothetical protein